MPTSVASAVLASQRLNTKALRMAKALLATATTLGIEAPKRRYRRRANGAAKPGPKPGKAKSKKTHLTKAQDEE